MKEKIIENKKLILIIGAVVLLPIIVGLVIWGIFGRDKEPTQEEVLKGYLQDMGVGFYEDFYYEQIGADYEARKTFLEKYKDIGIKVNLDNLSRYNAKENKEKIESFVNEETKEECDKENSKVIIYPHEPYNQKDYDMEIQLSCGFEEEK